MVTHMLSLLVVPLALLATACPQAPAVATGAVACASCVGGDVVANYSGPAPLPFYPGLCDKMLADCEVQCGDELSNIIGALAASKDPKVQATPAYQAALDARASMLRSLKK